ncbi:PREDICTED: uncharacterized protein LOC104814961 [Tarenaya hassleriana]|uniref:uncharacterized protein LOC104814961 n=1 Tax=Tarenaya hassleriana TaxID=28532 RepID=UPI00053C2E50|nr:PREDICTED: uncharacterized protein LOC104814961 [Tarenaya hassleriana]
MASLQCHKPAEQSHHVESQKACTETRYSAHEVVKTQVHCKETESRFSGHSQAHGHNRAGHNQAHGQRKKRGLFERIKDGLTGHGSGSDSSSSSSDSESDNEHGGPRKSC